MAVHDLDAASSLYERMGFTLSELSVHSGASKVGEPVQLMATGNRCAVFPHNYVELLGIVNPGKLDWGWGKFLDKFQGAHIICFGCQNPETVDHRAKASGVNTSGVVHLQRDVETATGKQTASFECVHLGSEPEGLMQAAYHRTPELIHQPRHLQHANGTIGISSIVLQSLDPAATAARYSVLTGQPFVERSNFFEITLPNQNRLKFVAVEDMAGFYPGSLFPPTPSIAAVGFSVKNLDDTNAFLAQAGFRAKRLLDQVIVPAEEALGVVHFFEQPAI
ncbi:VOC family protein [Ottowia thiooxydans]|uniref:VOC family protein n=1 Tax=Ottowia thiooxydans TaxID=219182 RepID=UPI00146F7019|nr:VOC family protein [Ottowia thiooxydans]